MPAISSSIRVTVVIDGDEFPIAFQGNYVRSPQEDRWLKHHALERATFLVEAGDFRPNGTLKVGRIE